MEDTRDIQDKRVIRFLSRAMISAQLTVLMLQVFGIINWEWYWLIAPVWMPIAFMLGTVLALMAVASVALWFRKRKK